MRYLLMICADETADEALNITLALGVNKKVPSSALREDVVFNPNVWASGHEGVALEPSPAMLSALRLKATGLPVKAIAGEGHTYLLRAPASTE